MGTWLRLTCAYCQAVFRIRAEYGHLRGRCPYCGSLIQAPRPRAGPVVPIPISGVMREPEAESEWPEAPVVEQPGYVDPSATRTASSALAPRAPSATPVAQLGPEATGPPAGTEAAQKANHESSHVYPLAQDSACPPADDQREAQCTAPDLPASVRGEYRVVPLDASEPSAPAASEWPSGSVPAGSENISSAPTTPYERVDYSALDLPELFATRADAQPERSARPEVSPTDAPDPTGGAFYRIEPKQSESGLRPPAKDHGPADPSQKPTASRKATGASRADAVRDATAQPRYSDRTSRRSGPRSAAGGLEPAHLGPGAATLPQSKAEQPGSDTTVATEAPTLGDLYRFRFGSLLWRIWLKLTLMFALWCAVHSLIQAGEQVSETAPIPGHYAILIGHVASAIVLVPALLYLGYWALRLIGQTAGGAREIYDEDETLVEKMQEGAYFWWIVFLATLPFLPLQLIGVFASSHDRGLASGLVSTFLNYLPLVGAITFPIVSYWLLLSRPSEDALRLVRRAKARAYIPMSFFVHGIVLTGLIWLIWKLVGGVFGRITLWAPVTAWAGLVYARALGYHALLLGRTGKKRRKRKNRQTHEDAEPPPGERRRSSTDIGQGP